MKKILIAAETFSPNLGDQLIFACQRYLLQQFQPDLQVIPLDLSYQTQSEYPAGTMPVVPLYKRFARFGEQYLGMPYALLNAALQWMRDFRHKTERKELLEDADLLLIAGGLLLMDNHLGFPIKLFDLTTQALHFQIPYHIMACGVSNRWSYIARKLFEPVIRRAESITLRDKFSIGRLQEELSIEAALCPDPALWAAHCFPRTSETPTDVLMGICPMNLSDFNHWLPASQKINKDAYLQWWCDVLNAFERDRIPWRMFTNDVPQDIQFAEELLFASSFSEADALLPRVESPEAFCWQIQSFSHVLSARMHPMISAHAYGIPALGVAWDRKLASYFAMVQQDSALIQMQYTDASDVPGILLKTQVPDSVVLDHLRAKTKKCFSVLFTG